MPMDYFYDLSARQVERGHNVDILTWSRNGESHVRKTPEGFNVYSLRGLNFAVPGIFEHYPYLPELPSVLEKIKPEIVHAESHLFLPTLQAVRKAKRLNLPSVVTVHGVFANRGYAINLFQNMYIRTLGLEIFKNSDIVICLSKSDIAEITHFGVSSEKIMLLNNAVDVELFKPAPTTFRDSTLIVWDGRFVSEKGIEYLIRAAKLVTQKSNEARFLLIGYGPLKSRMEALALHLGIPSTQIEFSNSMERKDIAKILSKSTLFVFPSLKEGMPLALLEAMASGNAIVASDITGVNEVIKNNHNGLIVPPRNAEAIATSILMLINDNDLKKKLALNARKTIEEKFSMSKMLTNLETIYLKAIRKHK